MKGPTMCRCGCGNTRPTSKLPRLRRRCWISITLVPPASPSVRPALGRAPPEDVRQRAPFVRERQRHRVEAMPLARRWRPIRKNVTQMAAAARTDFLDPDHPIARVANTSDMRLIIGFEEARPAGARVEFRTRPEQRQTAEAARVDAVLVVVEEHAAERRFRAMLEQHASLIRTKTCGDLRALRVGGRARVKLAHDDPRQVGAWGP